MKNKNYFLELPQMKINFDHFKPSEEIILIVGGRKPNVEWFNDLKRDRKIFCVDRGIDFCRENNFLPEKLIGDFDSAKKISLEWAIDHGVKIEKFPVDKDFTDTQLTLDRLNENNFAIVTGSFGGRFDHLYSTIYSCAFTKIKNSLIDEREAILFLSNGESMTIEFFNKPIALSLLPMNEICEGVTIDGVHWQLDKATLKNNFPNAISNRVESSTVKISIEVGTLAIYFCFIEN